MKNLAGKILVAVMLAAVAPARAESVQLAGGGQIRGVTVSPDETPERRGYTIALPNRLTIGLARAQVSRTIPDDKPEIVEYRRRAPFTPPTVEAQWALAVWCRERSLREQMQYHLLRVVELAPEHAEARRQLGQQRIDGIWTTRDEVLVAKGLLRDRGRWQYQQEIEIERAKESAKQSHALWIKRLRQLRSVLATSTDAKTELLALTDPDAAAALGILLSEESVSEVRRLYVLALGNIGTTQAAMILVTWAIDSHETSSDVRATCLEQIAQMHESRGPAIDYLVAQLRSSDNARINAAAKLLIVLGSPSVIPALIGVLQTKHSRTITVGGGTSYNPSAGGFAAGTSQVKQELWLENAAVLDALVRLTKQNFGYDREAWHRWWVDSQRAAFFNPRRTY